MLGKGLLILWVIGGLPWRSGVLAWNPGFEEAPIVACGSRNNFSPDGAVLELFSPSQVDAAALGKVSSSAPFSKLLWTECTNFSKCFLVGGLDNGTVSIWDSSNILSGEYESALVQSSEVYSTAVKGLGQSQFQSNLLVSGTKFGEVHLWDLNRMGQQSAFNFDAGDSAGIEVTDVAWNCRVPHIVAVSCVSGRVAIIDLRSKKTVTSISIPEAGGCVSSISWNPENPTNIIFANDHNLNPYLYSWDLKNPQSPENIFKGHTAGVLSTSWKNPEILLSSGRDGKVIAWNPSNSEVIKVIDHCEEILQVSWCFKDSDVFATCSGTNIEIKSFTSVSEVSEEEIATQKADEDTVHVEEAQNEAPIMPESSEPANAALAPRPIGAVFGPGLTCSVFRPDRRDVSVLKVASEEAQLIQNELEDFDNQLASISAFDICSALASDLSSTGTIWKVVALLFSQNFNMDMLDFIGFQAAEHAPESNFNSEITSGATLMERLKSHDSCSAGSLFQEGVSDIDRLITEKLLVSDIHGAVSACIDANRPADAIIIASCYGKDLREEVERHYVERSGRSYLKVAHGIRTRDMSELIENGSLEDWKELLGLLMNHSNPDLFTSLATKLASRLLEDKNYLGSATANMVAGDLYGFSNSVLAELFSRPSPSISFKQQFTALFDAYRFIRIMQLYSDQFIDYIPDESLKSKLYEVVLKFKYVLRLGGITNFASDSLVDYSTLFSALQGQNPDLDAILEAVGPETNNSTYDSTSHDTASIDYAQVSADLVSNQYYQQPYTTTSNTYNLSGSLTNPYLHASTESVQSYIHPQAPVYPVNPMVNTLPPQSVPAYQLTTTNNLPQPTVVPPVPMHAQIIKSNPPISPTWTPEGSPKTYNDAPIVNPRGSSLASEMASMNVKEWNHDEVESAINLLAETADQKCQGPAKKLVADCRSKLTTATICRYTYSAAVLSQSIALFKAINEHNWELSSKIATSLVSAYFSETKDWILNLKRVLDIAKL